MIAIIKKIYFLLHWLNKPREMIYCRLRGVKWHYTWKFNGLPYIQRRSDALVSIGEHFIANSAFASNSLGCFQRCVIRAGVGATIRIGHHVGISGTTISAANAISIGNHVMIGSGALITDTDSHPLDPIERRHGGGGVSKPIIIGDDVFIGARAIILKGVRLGCGCIVGAGAVVTKDVMERTIVAGNPARVVGYI